VRRAPPSPSSLPLSLDDFARDELFWCTAADSLLERARRVDKQHQVTTQRERALEKFEPHTWKAVLWLREHQNEFRGRIYEPARLSTSMKKQFGNVKLSADLVEGPIPMSAFNVRPCPPLVPLVLSRVHF